MITNKQFADYWAAYTPAYERDVADGRCSQHELDRHKAFVRHYRQQPPDEAFVCLTDEQFNGLHP